MDGSLAQKLKFDSIANNLANINTIGFKKDIISFNRALALKNFSRIDLSPGPVRHTGNQLDVALDGSGFFKIQTPRGIRYTKDGSFTLDTNHRLITQGGDTVLGQDGPIQINGSKVSIAGNGDVYVNNDPVGRISVVDFTHPQLLRKDGTSHFTYQGEDQDVFPCEDVNLRQNYIETSNVNPTEEMIKMVESLRIFESTQKANQTLDEMTSKIVNDPALIQI